MLGSQSARACNALTFDLNNYGIDLDPHIQQFTRRVSLMRRMVSKHPHIRDTVFELWDIYQKGKTPGTLTLEPIFRMPNLRPLLLAIKAEPVGNPLGLPMGLSP